MLVATMRSTAMLLLGSLVLGSSVVLAAVRASEPVAGQEDERDPIRSRVEVLPTGERILVEEVVVEAPLADVWSAYTTEAGYTAWAAPKARIDLRVGGTILTHYRPDAEIGDPGTNTLHIVNYVPERILTLRAEAPTTGPR